MAQTLVTGAAGFIGSHLCAALGDRGVRVAGVDNFDAFYPRDLKQANLRRVQSRAPSAFAFHERDILDAPSLASLFNQIQPSAVFHLAALAGVRPSIEQPGRYAAVNVNGLVNVLEASRAVDCRNVIFASSSSVYGNNAKVPFAEDDPVERPISPYAATKRAGELMCQTYARVYGLRIAALRLFTVYGPAQRPDLAIAKFMRLIAAGEVVPMFGDGSSSRDYTYIDDVIEGVLAAHAMVLNPSAPGSAGGHDNAAAAGFFRIYNLGSDRPIPLAEMIDAIAKVVGKPARITRQPMQAGDVERTWADLTRSRAELGYDPRVSFAEGLREQWLAHQAATISS